MWNGIHGQWESGFSVLFIFVKYDFVDLNGTE